jgi:hypothetical protein
MKYKLLILVILVTVLFAQLIHHKYIDTTPVTVFRKGLIIGDIDLSNKTWSEGISLLNEVFDKPLYLDTDNTSRAIRLAEMGIAIDKDRLARYTKVCRYGQLSILCKNTSNEPISPYELVQLDNGKLLAYLDALEAEFQFVAENTVISFEDYSFWSPGPFASIKLDRTPFESKEALVDLISQEDISIDLILETKGYREAQDRETSQRIADIAQPLLIKYGGTPIYIPADVVSTFVVLEEGSDRNSGVISKSEIASYLDTLMEEYESESVHLLKADAVVAIQRALLLKSTNHEVNKAVILPIEGQPHSNGDRHDYYLELIKSQQRLYRFEGGSLAKTYVVSTGLTWDTPAGEYEVLGKQKMTISYFGNWYMPNYLPIGTISGVYRFGFHAIPYHMDALGNIYSRDENTMGSPATGGCIQLVPDEAFELFEWARVGTPVYIYE